jgi:sulfatase modifying factor 1
MATGARLRLDEVERKVCDVASVQLGIRRDRISPGDRIVEDLNCDSLDLVELFMEVEEEFDVTLPDDSPNPIFKAVFTRQGFRLADLAELVYLVQGAGTPDRKAWRRARRPSPPPTAVPFTQLGGRWEGPGGGERPPFESLDAAGPVPQYRRRSDGMRCLLVPLASVEIGGGSPDAPADEQPRHLVEIGPYLIDAEPVSTTAYCRFLNSVGDVAPEILADWFVLDPDDDRKEHMLVQRVGSEWHPLPATERWPMILVSWYGANAYSLWANGRGWKGYRGEGGAEPESLLPTEAQWEYAARGASYRPFPWGDDPPSQDRMRYGRHRKGAAYRADTLPMAYVNAELGMSPFGLHHMAGNVWQWCRDWYDDGFYTRPEASRPNPVNRTPGKVRSERGGSWIGPASLCRSSSRRGRPPAARGRCLGFRCVGPIP